MLPVLVVPSPRPRRHFGAAAGGVHPIITDVRARRTQSSGSTRDRPRNPPAARGREDFRADSRARAAGADEYWTGRYGGTGDGGVGIGGGFGHGTSSGGRA